MIKTHISNSAEETMSIGEQLASSFKGGEVIALHGNLGAGKTTFVQGVARGLGIHQAIISPTFILVREYAASDKTLYHIDLYRLEDTTDIQQLGLADMFGNKQAIVIIEWAEKIAARLPKNTRTITFIDTGENTREIQIENYA